MSGNSTVDTLADGFNFPCIYVFLQEPGSTQTSPLALFLIAVIVVLLFIIIFTAIPAQKHRLISAIVHSIAGGKAQRMLILVILMFLCSWFIWWIVRQAGSYH